MAEGAGGRVRRLARRPVVALRRRRQRPVLSVVMPVYGVRGYLPAVLDSILAQDLGELGTLEVVAVDDASVDGSLDVLRAYARRDHRVRVLRQENAGQGPARDRGLREVRGDFLTFVDGDDVVPPGAFARMVRSLRGSGSDFVVGDTRRFAHGVFAPLAWSRVVHGRDRTGTTLAEFPQAVFDAILCNRMFRTEFWRAQGLPFKPRIPFQDHQPIMAAYVRAERFDVLREVTYHWRNREDRTSTTQQKARLATLRHRVDVMGDTWAMFAGEAAEVAQDAYLARSLEVDLPPFVPHAIGGDADYRTTLRDLYRTFLDRARERPVERVLDLVSARQKIRAVLAADGEWDALATVDGWFDEAGVVPPAVAEDGTAVVDLARVPDDAVGAVGGVPLWARRLSVLESSGEGGILRAGRVGEAIVLTGWYVVRGLSAVAPSMAAWLASEGGERVDLAVRPVDLPEANLWGRQRFADYTAAGFVATVPLDALPGIPGTLALTVSTTDAGVTRAGPVLHHLPRTSGARPLRLDGVATRWDPALGYVLDVAPGLRAAAPEPGPRVAGATASGSVLTLHLTDGGVHEVPLADPRPVDLAVDDSLLGDLPLRLTTSRATAVVGVAADGGVLVEVEPPLPAEVWGLSGRTRAEASYADLDLPVGDGTLLVDGPDTRPLVDRLDRPATRAVADLLDPPPGAVLLGDPAYYRALAAAAWVVDRQAPGPWFVPRPGQRSFTVPAAHPWAAFGRARWERDGLTAARIRREAERARRTHDLVAAPSEEVAAWYVDQLDLAAEQVVVTGYPRLDRLAGLPAPSGERVLCGVPGLGLGTDHSPDLFLGDFDVAVLGVDALRFDWAVTGRPMVFYAPDLDADLERVGPLVPWESSAPGPVCRTVEEVREALADLDGLRASYVEEIAAFNARFNPLADGHAAERVAALLV